VEALSAGTGMGLFRTGGGLGSFACMDIKAAGNPAAFALARLLK